ncbi:MAG: pyridoxal-phosphate dependent enzyme [Thermoanaerobaculia bacterium]
MPKLGLETEVADQEVFDNTVQRFREAEIALPTFAELADPTLIPETVQERLTALDPDRPHPLNLFRVHWYNAKNGDRFSRLPEHLALPASLTGVRARIVILLADRFPMIHAHKVLATYGCLAPRVIMGQFDPTRHKAIWPSTGNYCRGGVAVSRIMGCRGVAVLPEGMSRERFDWLESWVNEPEDIIRTPGTESNVKEIYDRCAELERQAENIIFNQFSEFGNYLAHFLCTGQAAGRLFEAISEGHPDSRLRAFVSATGSAGTLAAGDALKERYGSSNVAVEAVECPTLLENGFGEHNIQGIGDKHIPLIHNVMNTDVVTAVSDRATDSLLVLFNTEVGRRYLVERKQVEQETVAELGRLGLSSLCNLLAAIKTAKHFELEEDDVILTVATDGAELYASELEKILARDFPSGFDEVEAAEIFGRDLAGAATDHLQELSYTDRRRIFNLGYYTWVEQQGVTLEDFEIRRQQKFWRQLRDLVPVWDEMIRDFNARTETIPS